MTASIVCTAALLMCLASISHAHMLHVAGSGTTNPSRAYWHMMEHLKDQTSQDLALSYRAVGSTTGMKEFTGDATSNYQSYTAFGSGDVPLKADYYTTLTNNNGTMVHLPVTLGAVGIFHSLPPASLTGHIGLNLTHCHLADIFSGEITHWNDDKILMHNPALTNDQRLLLDNPIQVLVRTRGSSSTAAVTNYFSTCDTWTLGTGSLISWPSHVTLVEGSGGMTAALQGNEYAIGYIDSGHGHDAGLAEIELRNKDGNYVDSKSASLATAAQYALDNGLIPPDATADWSSVSLLDLPGADTWPLTALTFVYVRKDLSFLGDNAALLKAFLTFVLSDVGQTIFTEYNFAKLPDALVAAGLTTLSLLENVGGTEWTFETSTTPYTGAGDFVFSVKRKDFIDLEVDELRDEITALKATIAAMEANHATMQENHATMQENHATMISEHGTIMENHANMTTSMPSNHNGRLHALESQLATHTQTMQRNDLSLTQQVAQLATTELRLYQLEQDANSNSKSIAIGAIVLAVISILMNVVTILSARGTKSLGTSMYSESEL